MQLNATTTELDCFLHPAFELASGRSMRRPSGCHGRLHASRAGVDGKVSDRCLEREIHANASLLSMCAASLRTKRNAAAVRDGAQVISSDREILGALP
ncbi:MAG: hypothetical protein ABR584_10535, partial [Candidatus Baltobacteraceae bacterium]